jgi:nucleoside-diphosphate-sugar epimerase
MQTILGAGGAIAMELVKELAHARQPVRLVGRNPKLVDGAIEAVSADISNLDQTIRAVSSSAIVHLLVG